MVMCMGIFFSCQVPVANSSCKSNSAEDSDPESFTVFEITADCRLFSTWTRESPPPPPVPSRMLLALAAGSDQGVLRYRSSSSWHVSWPRGCPVTGRERGREPWRKERKRKAEKGKGDRGDVNTC